MSTPLIKTNISTVTTDPLNPSLYCFPKEVILITSGYLSNEPATMRLLFDTIHSGQVVTNYTFSQHVIATLPNTEARALEYLAEGLKSAIFRRSLADARLFIRETQVAQPKNTFALVRVVTREDFVAHQLRLFINRAYKELRALPLDDLAMMLPAFAPAADLISPSAKAQLLTHLHVYTNTQDLASYLKYSSIRDTICDTGLTPCRNSEVYLVVALFHGVSKDSLESLLIVLTHGFKSIALELEKAVDFDAKLQILKRHFDKHLHASETPFMGKCLIQLCEYGYQPLVSALLTGPEMDSFRSIDLGDAFCAAAANGETSIVKSFIASRRFSEISARTIGQALQTAAQGGHTSIVSMIIALPHFKTIPVENLGNAFRCASDERSISIVVEQRHREIRALLIASTRFDDIPLSALSEAIGDACDFGDVDGLLQIVESSRFHQIPKEEIGNAFRRAVAAGERGPVRTLIASSRFGDISAQTLGDAFASCPSSIFELLITSNRLNDVPAEALELRLKNLLPVIWKPTDFKPDWMKDTITEGPEKLQRIKFATLIINAKKFLEIPALTLEELYERSLVFHPDLATKIILRRMQSILIAQLEKALLLAVNYGQEAVVYAIVDSAKFRKIPIPKLVEIFFVAASKGHTNIVRKILATNRLFDITTADLKAAYRAAKPEAFSEAVNKLLEDSAQFHGCLN
jgi:hypothetical protein